MNIYIKKKNWQPDSLQAIPLSVSRYSNIFYAYSYFDNRNDKTLKDYSSNDIFYFLIQRMSNAPYSSML